MSYSVKERRQMVKQGKSGLSITQQCFLLSLVRSGLYYKPRDESKFNLKLMRVIDEQYLKTPYYGVARMTAQLRRQGHKVNPKRIRRLYRKMGLEAIYPKQNLSKPGKGHKIYPYLLRGLKVERPNQVWAVDITYIPMRRGFMYLVAIIDLYSRFVVGWGISNTLEAKWCTEVLAEAIEVHGKPEIINSDQGSQFTSEVWIKACKGIRISMDGKGRAIDNVFIERLWRRVKYEHVYLHPAKDGLELYEGLATYFQQYNYEEVHQGIDYQIPCERYKKAA